MLNVKAIKLKSYTLSVTTSMSINPFNQIANNLHELNDNIDESLKGIKDIARFFTNIGKFFKEMYYWISHPIEVINAFQPWIIIILMSLIVLKLLGFKTDKWLSLFFLLFILILVF